MNIRNPLLPLLVFAVLSLPVSAQDRVEYRDAKDPSKTLRAIGDIETEDPGKVVVKSEVRTTTIPSASVINVIYSHEIDVEEMGKARTAEKANRIAEAIKLYEAALKKTPSRKFAQANVKFKIAKLKTDLVEEGGDRIAAIEAMRTFRKEFPEARQTLECLKLLSRMLQGEPGASQEEVIAGFQALRAKYGGAGKDIARECDLFEIRLLMQAGQNLLKDKGEEAKKKYAEAAAKLEEMVKDKDIDANLALEMKVSLSECRAGQGDYPAALKELDDLMKSAADELTKAAVYLGRGDCFRLQAASVGDGNVNARDNLLRRAMWEYLWVDVIYNKNVDQTAKALYHLEEIFKKVGEADRAKECRERLMGKEFAASRYQKMPPP